MNRVKRCRYGEMIHQPHDAHIGRSLDLYGEFSESAVALFRELVGPGQTVLDVGANIGAHTVALATLVGPTGRVLAFEPRRALFYCLCGNVAINGLDQVRCQQAAVGDAQGQIQVPEVDGPPDNNSDGLSPAQDLRGRATYPVPLLRIDDLKLAACDLIKVDVEGMECQVLKGAAETIRRFQPVLYVEHDRTENSAALRDWLRREGYEMQQHPAPLFNPANYAGNPRNVFANVVSSNLFCHPRGRPPRLDPRRHALVRIEPGELAAMPSPVGEPPATVLDLARRAHQSGDLEQAVQRYRQALAVDPNHAQSWYLLGAACQTLGRLDEAAAALQQALAIQPRHAESRNHLGVVLGQQGRLDEAMASFRQALELKPGDPEVLNNLGLTLLKQDHKDEAERAFREILRLKPDDVKARRSLHDLLRAAGRVEELVASQREAVGNQADSVPARMELAVTLLDRRRPDEAALILEEVLRLKPDAAEAHNNLGMARAAAGRREDAIACYRRAVAIKPDFAQAHNNLGIALRQQGQLEAAVASCREAVRLRPDLPEGHNNLGSALEESGRMDEAVASLAEALRLRPDFAKAHNNLGIAFWHQGRLDEAIASCRRAIELMPDLSEAHNNLGNVLRDEGRLDEALGSYEQAIAIKSDYADPYWNRSLVRLLQGDLTPGWADYEWRWKLPSFVVRKTDRPKWDGSALEGRTLLIDTEQGLGDSIQFIRYAPWVRQRGGRVHVVCPKALLRLLSSCAGIDQLLPQGDPIPPFDTYTPLLSLPYILGTTLDTIPAEVPYLAADAELIEGWRGELASLAGFKIGIAWQGSPKNRTDRLRSIPLAEFEPLARVPGARLLSLQKGLGSEQVAALKGRFDCIDLAARLDNESGPFMDTAAVMRHLDLVITCDSAMAHLAGALAVPVWIALPFSPDWRWMLARDDSPWYPTARLFRQQKLGQWAPVFERMARELAR
ncbi:MAG TPA: FkbM family methyltransferase [Pirellulales bacterium]|nr:FkbM family methyltransferase [Pirellulales bacterium]